MMERNPNKRQALVNELKGNLFEYLLAQNLVAKNPSAFAKFLTHLPANYLARLESYQQELLVLAPELYQKLPTLAQKAADFLRQQLNLELVTEVLLVGKLDTAAKFDGPHETDLVIKSEQDCFFLSLKLSKPHAYVNTKSAGASSFLEKYFSAFPEASFIQIDFNQVLALEFRMLAHDLSNLKGLENQTDFTLWTKEGHPTLPGDLDSESHARLMKFYQHLNAALYQTLKGFYEQDPDLFHECLRPLLGLSAPELNQFIVFDDGPMIFHAAGFYQKTLPWEWNEISAGDKSFELEWPSVLKFQIRPKPMNEFTKLSFKINCSVKHLNV